MAVREGILAILEHGPAHGYKLKSTFDSASGGSWNLNIGQIYTTLDRLERDGLVDSHHEGDKTLYSLTDKGSAAAGDWWEASADLRTNDRDELVLKVLLAIELDKRRALDVISQQRDQMLMLLQQRQQFHRAIHEEDLGNRLIADARIVRAEADLRWLDLAEERIVLELRHERTREQQRATVEEGNQR